MQLGAVSLLIYVTNCFIDIISSCGELAHRIDESSSYPDFVPNRSFAGLGELVKKAITPVLPDGYLVFSARLSRNTPCSPNMFQNHHGALNRSGRP